MSEDTTESIAEALQQGREGLDALMPLVYRELCKVAHSKMRSERASHTLNTAAVVNETYMRLRRLREVPWKTKDDFVAFAGGLMRNFLVDYARRRNAAKRPGGRQQVTLEAAGLPHAYQQPFDVLVVHEALEQLATRDPKFVQVIDLLFFSGLTQEEAAKILGVSRSKLQEQWTLAKGFLAQFISS